MAIRISITSIGLVARTRVFAVVSNKRLALGFGRGDLAVGPQGLQRAAKLVSLDVQRLGHGALRAELLPGLHGANGEDDLVEIGRIGRERGERMRGSFRGPAGGRLHGCEVLHNDARRISATGRRTVYLPWIDRVVSTIVLVEAVAVSGKSCTNFSSILRAIVLNHFRMAAATENQP